MKLLTLICSLLVGVAGQNIQAQGFIANMDGAQDGGGARTGTGQVLLYLTGTTLSFSNGTYSGLSGTVTLAHIHGPAPIGSSAGAIFDLIPTFITTGASSGTIAAGNVSLSAANANNLLNGLLYINIHTTTFGGGEIRGQILPIPEPSSAALILLGMSLVGIRFKTR
jgi:hypothetical protein